VIYLHKDTSAENIPFSLSLSLIFFETCKGEGGGGASSGRNAGSMSIKIIDDVTSVLKWSSLNTECIYVTLLRQFSSQLFICGWFPDQLMDVFLTEDPVQCSRLLHNNPVEAQRGISCTHFSPPRYLKVSAQHHTPAYVPPSKNTDTHLEGACVGPKTHLVDYGRHIIFPPTLFEPRAVRSLGEILCRLRYAGQPCWWSWW
jgi:hypothetical protein